MQRLSRTVQRRLFCGSLWFYAIDPGASRPVAAIVVAAKSVGGALPIDGHAARGVGVGYKQPQRVLDLTSNRRERPAKRKRQPQRNFHRNILTAFKIVRLAQRFRHALGVAARCWAAICAARPMQTQQSASPKPRGNHQNCSATQTYSLKKTFDRESTSEK